MSTKAGFGCLGAGLHPDVSMHFAQKAAYLFTPRALHSMGKWRCLQLLS